MSTYENFLMSSASFMAGEDDPEAVAMTATESAACLIEEFGAIGDYRNGTYNKLHGIVSGAVDFAAAETLLDSAEDLFIRNNFSAERVAAETTKGGKVKKTKFLPNDYRSAKSVLLNALANGVALFDENGDPLGKSAISAAVSGSTKSDQQKLDAAMASVLRYARAIHGEFVTVVVEVAVDGSITDRAST